jgi:hypothetical protein
MWKNILMEFPNKKNYKGKRKSANKRKQIETSG